MRHLALAFLKDPPKGKTEEVASYVNLSPVAVPVIVDGKVVNYVFVRVRVNLTPGVDSPAIREKEPFFRDALVRAAHRTPFTLAADHTKVDEARLTAQVLADTRRIVGAAAVRNVQILSQTPKTTRVATARP